MLWANVEPPDLKFVPINVLKKFGVSKNFPFVAFVWSLYRTNRKNFCFKLDNARAIGTLDPLFETIWLNFSAFENK